MEQKLMFINLENNILKFYNIKIEKNKNKYYVVVTKGKIGNKGVTNIVYTGSDYDVCKNEFWKRVNDKKAIKYKPYAEVLDEINKIFEIKGNQYTCDICHKELEKKLYFKINSYLRKETSVDDDKDHDLCNKVACFECQSKFNLYKGKNK